MDAQYKDILWKKRENGVLVAAHRGTSGGNIIRNTCLSYENALLHGADIIETDGVLSTDGVFFAFHDGEEEVMWGERKDIRKMSSAEIEALPCRNWLNAFTAQHVERFEVILERLRNRCLINVDRTWFYWKEIIRFLDKFKMYDQIILKAPAEETYLKELEESGSPVMFMPIIRTVNEWKLVQKYNVNTVAVEIVFENLDDAVVQEAFLTELHKAHVLIWGNTLVLSDDVTLSAHLDDNRAILNGPDMVWGRLIDMGFDIIQTDWPALLKNYVSGQNLR